MTFAVFCKIRPTSKLCVPDAFYHNLLNCRSLSVPDDGTLCCLMCSGLRLDQLGGPTDTRMFSSSPSPILLPEGGSRIQVSKRCNSIIL
jgi:hypothetical protein